MLKIYLSESISQLHYRSLDQCNHSVLGQISSIKKVAVKLENKLNYLAFLLLIQIFLKFICESFKFGFRFQNEQKIFHVDIYNVFPKIFSWFKIYAWKREIFIKRIPYQQQSDNCLEENWSHYSNKSIFTNFYNIIAFHLYLIANSNNSHGFSASLPVRMHI